MAINKALFSSRSYEWETPEAFFRPLDAQWNFDLDVCASADNAKCKRYFTREQDGLRQEWTGVCWMNPPYGRSIGAWVAKAAASTASGTIVVALLPARTDTRWWHQFIEPIRERRLPGRVQLIKGRLKFGGANNSAPFPSALVLFLPYLTKL